MLFSDLGALVRIFVGGLVSRRLRELVGRQVSRLVGGELIINIFLEYIFTRIIFLFR